MEASFVKEVAKQFSLSAFIYFFDIPYRFCLLCAGKDSNILGILGTVVFLATIIVDLWAESRRYFESQLSRVLIYISWLLPVCVLTTLLWGIFSAAVRYYLIQWGLYCDNSIFFLNAVQFSIGLEVTFWAAMRRAQREHP